MSMPIELSLKYDRTSDALYVKIKEGKMRESGEISPGVIVDYDEKGEVAGMETLRFSKRKIDLSKFITEGPEAAVLSL